MPGRTGRPTARRPPPLDPLADRLVAAGDGDEDAFTEVYDQMAHRVYGIALRVLRDPRQAEEVGQEAFVEIWTRASSFDPDRGSAVAWMITIAHRRAVDRVRSSSAARRRDDAWHEADDRARSADPTFEATDARLAATSVRAAMASLSTPQRRAVELAYFGGHTYPEVSVLMRAPLGTTKTRIRTALLQLRRQLQVAGLEVPGPRSTCT